MSMTCLHSARAYKAVCIVATHLAGVMVRVLQEEWLVAGMFGFCSPLSYLLNNYSIISLNCLQRTLPFESAWNVLMNRNH